MTGGGRNDTDTGRRDDGARRGRWDDVRRGGRVAFHLVIAVATIAVCVAGEAVGNLIFRRGDHLGDRVADAALFGFVAGNLLAWWIWRREDAKA